MSKCTDNPEYDNVDNSLQNTWKQSTYIEPKEEILEEAAEEYSKLKVNKDGLMSDRQIKDFIAGAKWQAERMYSEEEVEKIVRDAYTFGEKEFKHFGAFEEWFEQFKKK